MRTLTFEGEEGVQFHYFLFKNVTNIREIQEQLRSINAAFLSAKVILNELQLHITASRVLRASRNSKMVTNTIHSELLFVLSGGNSVRSAFTRFGISADDTEIVVGVFNPTASRLDTIRNLVKGDEVDEKDLQNEFSSLCDRRRLIQFYGLKENPSVLQSDQSLLSAIVTAIACQKI